MKRKKESASEIRELIDRNFRDSGDRVIQVVWGWKTNSAGGAGREKRT